MFLFIYFELKNKKIEFTWLLNNFPLSFKAYSAETLLKNLIRAAFSS